MASYKIDLINSKNSEYQLLGKNISAVFLIAFNEKSDILSCRNERGWDIPGGHIEGKESLEEGLLREVQEETGASFNNPIPFALLTLEGVNKSMLFYASDNFTFGNFIVAEDALEREVLPSQDLIKRYHGDKMLLTELISFAENSLTKNQQKND